jgi:hypothetical protein
MSTKDVIKTVMKDITTTSVGDYDPARVVGYGSLVMGSLVFLGLSIYDTIVNGKFNYEGFSLGLVAISTAVAGAAAGVWIKKGTERPGEELQRIKIEGVEHGNNTATATAKEASVGQVVGTSE